MKDAEERRTVIQHQGADTLSLGVGGYLAAGQLATI